MRHQRRTLSVFPDGEGMYVLTGRLDPEVGAALMRAVEAASDALYRGEREVTGSPDAADLEAGRALHVEEATLAEKGEPGQSELEDGTRVTAETAGRLACDTSVVEVRHACTPGEAARTEAKTGADHGAGGPRPGVAERPMLDVGRKTRTIPPALRRALDSRDRGCRFPGCGLRFTDAHHIRHWADGGKTELKNLVLLCRRHHRRVHEEGYRVCQDVRGQLVFFTPRGKPSSGAEDADAPYGSGAGPGTTEPEARRHPEPWGTTQRYRYDRFVPWEVEAAVLSALDPP